MFCIYCQGWTRVTNTRFKKRQNNVWRRRKCEDCNRIFTTNEILDYERAWTVFYPGEKVIPRKPEEIIRTGNYKEFDPFAPKAGKPFQREKLFMSIYNSLQHRENPINDAVGITDTVIAKLTYAGITKDGNDAEGYLALTSTAIATAAVEALHRLDRSAATMYRAYHADVL